MAAWPEMDIEAANHDEYPPTDDSEFEYDSSEEEDEQYEQDSPECPDPPVSTGSSVRRLTGEFNAAWNSIAATLRSGRVEAIPEDFVNELLENMWNIDRVSLKCSLDNVARCS